MTTQDLHLVYFCSRASPLQNICSAIQKISKAPIPSVLICEGSMEGGWLSHPINTESRYTPADFGMDGWWVWCCLFASPGGAAASKIFRDWRHHKTCSAAMRTQAARTMTRDFLCMNKYIVYGIKQMTLKLLVTPLLFVSCHGTHVNWFTVWQKKTIYMYENSYSGKIFKSNKQNFAWIFRS